MFWGVRERWASGYSSRPGMAVIRRLMVSLESSPCSWARRILVRL